MIELKPCPFCGGKADLVAYDVDEYMVQCSACIGAAGQGYGSQSSSWTDATKDEAITAWNTRAEPDVPELVRLAWSMGGLYQCETGFYTDYGKAAEIIAAKDKEIAALNKLNALVTKQREEANAYGDEGHKRAEAAEGELITIANHLDCEADIDSILHTVREIEADKDIYKERAEAAEAKLAQYEGQKPIGYLSSEDVAYLNDGKYSLNFVMPRKSPVWNIAVYASPAPAADLKAENEKLRLVAKRYLDASKEHFHQSDYVTDGELADADAELFVLVTMEASHDKG